MLNTVHFDPWQRSLFVPSVSSANAKEKGPLLAGNCIYCSYSWSCSHSGRALGRKLQLQAVCTISVATFPQWTSSPILRGCGSWGISTVDWPQSCPPWFARLTCCSSASRVGGSPSKSLPLLVNKYFLAPLTLAKGHIHF